MTTETAAPSRNRELRALEQKLSQLRDELRLKIHLGRADARDEFDRLELKLQRFRASLGDPGEVTEELREDVREGLHNIALELRDGYEKIRRLL